MTTVLEKKVVISAEDRTGSSFAGIERRIDLLSKASKRLSGGISGKVDLVSARMSNFGYDKNLKAGADIISRMSMVGRSADKASALLAGLGKRMDSVGKTSERLGGIGGKLDLVAGGMSNFDSRIRGADMISRMSQVSSGAEKASSSLGGLGRSLSGLGAVVAPLVALKVKDFAVDVIHTFREFDKERRYGKAVMGLTDEEQEPLVKQAIHGGATSKYNDIQWLEAQRTLAARGLNLPQILALTKVAANLGQAMDLTLPEASTVLEGGMFGFGKKTSTYEEAVAGAQRTADLQVKASKIFGMTPEDITSGYKTAAAPFHLSGLSEELMLTFLGLGKKANMGGDEMGTAGRAVVANLLKPTSGARTAMMASGIDYSKYQTQGSHPMDAENFAKSIAATYGVKLSKEAQASLQHVFNNKSLVADAAKFMPAVMNVLGMNFPATTPNRRKASPARRAATATPR